MGEQWWGRCGGAVVKHHRNNKLWFCVARQSLMLNLAKGFFTGKGAFLRAADGGGGRVGVVQCGLKGHT